MTINPQTMQQQIHSDIQACEQLLALLATERQALTDRDMDTLDGLIEQKAQQLSHLEQSAQTRTGWMRELSQGSSDPEELKKIWESRLVASAPALKDAWERLKGLQKACQKENEINGKILAKNQKTFSRLLDIVRGQTASPNLYSATGQASSSSYSNKVGEA